MNEYCQREGHNLQKCQFWHKGVKIYPDERTSASLDFENNTIIEFKIISEDKAN